MSPTGAAVIGNLPAELSSFVGRRGELDEVRRLLSASRLVTLTGVGGTGKTRLAVRSAGELRRVFPDGVWFVDLGELNMSEFPVLERQDPDVLAFLLMGTLGLRERSGRTPLESLVEQLAERRVLLILDNCEHLVSACALLAGGLLRGCPGLRVLATSREKLGIDAEVLFEVPPLHAPETGHRSSLAQLRQYESVMLFAARAEAIVPGFALGKDNGDAVAELCHRLDGLPLAIELAASRVRVLAPQQILDRLTDRFALLTSGRRSAPARQQTLRACLDWSFDLCGKPERLLWARLSVFAGSFDLRAAEEVCADEQLPEADVLGLVAGLVDQSILVRDDGDDLTGTVRYRMLESIRDYGRARLREVGEEVALRRRHRDWCQKLLTCARAEWVSDRQAYWMALLPLERSNLRAAVEFCAKEPGEAEAGLRLAVTLPPLYWRANGLFGEGRHWLDRALTMVTEPTALRARGLLVNSRLAFSLGDTATARRLLAEGEDLARRLGDPGEMAYATLIRGIGVLYANDPAAAVDILEPAWQSLAQTPDRDSHLCQNVLSILCQAAGLAGQYELAIARQQEMLAMLESIGESQHRSDALRAGGLIAWHSGNLHDALARVTEALRCKGVWASHDQPGVAQCVEVLAWITADQRRHRRAAVLLGAAEATWTEVGTAITSLGHLAGYHDKCERQLRAALGDAAFAEAVDHGRSLPYDDVIAYALEEQKEPVPAPPVDRSSTLTRRERQIADLLAQGLSNKEIAATLVISIRTAEGHVENVLAKLGFTSRARVAAWSTQQTENRS
jgi:predicted ATPase/DNA-binding NarL/FixJ family response regulator